MKRFLIAAVLVFQWISLSGAHAGTALPNMGPPAVGDKAPEFELEGQDGKKVRLTSLRGDFVVLSFGASFCPYSRALLPNLEKLAGDYSSKGVKVLLVDVKETKEKYDEYAHRMPLNFPVLRDETGKVAESYAPPKAQPALKNRSLVPVAGVLIVDKEGKIRFYSLLDTKNFDDKLDGLRAALDRALSEGGH